MQLHQVKPTPPSGARKKKKRVGRGGKRGTYSGKGLKGQKARAGRKLRPELRDIIKKIPKKRGYRFKSLKGNISVLNLSFVNNKFADGEVVSPQTLVEKKILRKNKGKLPKVKILGVGKLDKKIDVSGCDLSKTTEEKIKKAGGKIE